MQVLADVRRELHRTDEDEEYAEQHRERLEHYRTHLDGLVGVNQADRLPEANGAAVRAAIAKAPRVLAGSHLAFSSWSPAR